MTTPIIHDECRTTALDIDSAGQIYGGAGGPRTPSQQMVDQEARRLTRLVSK